MITFYLMLLKSSSDFWAKSCFLSTVENMLSMCFEIRLQTSTWSLWKLCFLFLFFINPGELNLPVKCNLELKCCPCMWNLGESCFEGNINRKRRSFARRDLGLYQSGDVIFVIKMVKILIALIRLRINTVHCKCLTDFRPLYLR